MNFQLIFEYTFDKDDRLKNCFSTIPKNACYTSVQFQNEAIQIMCDMVKKEVLQNILSADCSTYTLKVDGTRHKTNTENVSIVIRYVLNWKVKEDLIGMPTTENLDANSLSQLLIHYLNGFGLKPANILSQCFDDASVMAGCKGGVQQKLQEAVGKPIPYVHCFNHQLHSVIVHAISEEPLMSQHFGVCAFVVNCTFTCF